MDNTCSTTFVRFNKTQQKIVSALYFPLYPKLSSFLKIKTEYDNRSRNTLKPTLEAKTVESKQNIARMNEQIEELKVELGNMEKTLKENSYKSPINLLLATTSLFLCLNCSKQTNDFDQNNKNDLTETSFYKDTEKKDVYDDTYLNYLLQS